MEEAKITFSKNIDYLIKSKVVSVPTLCKITGKQRTLIYKWSYGDRQPSFSDTIKLARFLGVSVDDLIAGDISHLLKNNYDTEKEEEIMFCRNIKYLLDGKIISVKTLMQVTGAKESMISMWRNGKRKASINDYIRICRYLNIKLDDLILNDISQIIKK